MRNSITRLFGVALPLTTSVVQTNDPLVSRNEGKAEIAITRFVQATTTEDGNDYVQVAERIAVFDNDGAR